MDPGSGCLATVSASLSVSTKALAVRGQPSDVMNAGPSRGGRAQDTYVIHASMGQYSDKGMLGSSMLIGGISTFNSSWTIIHGHRGHP